MNPVFRVFRMAAIVMVLCLAVATVRVCGQQQEAVAAPTKTVPTPIKAEDAKPASLALTPDEIKVAAPLWNELQSQQREYTLAIDNLRRAVKKPNDKDAHSQAALALSVVLENSEQSQAKWYEWINRAQAAHDCKDCSINVQKWEFIRFPTEKNASQ